MVATAVTAFQVRVRWSIGTICATPPWSSPTSAAGCAAQHQTSAVGSLRVPSLSFSRRISKLFGRPSASLGST